MCPDNGLRYWQTKPRAFVFRPRRFLAAYRELGLAPQEMKR